MIFTLPAPARDRGRGPTLTCSTPGRLAPAGPQYSTPTSWPPTVTATDVALKIPVPHKVRYTWSVAGPRSIGRARTPPAGATRYTASIDCDWSALTRTTLAAANAALG